MKKIIFIALYVLSVSAIAQKHSISLKTGVSISNTGNYKAKNMPDTTYTSSYAAPNVGVSYTYTPLKWISLSIEPSLSLVGHNSLQNDLVIPNSTTGVISRQNRSAYLSIPVVPCINIGKDKIIVGIEAGLSGNFLIKSKQISPSYFTQALVGVRAGYKITDKISVEAYYRYAESLSNYVAENTLSTNFIGVQTRISF